MPFLKKKSKHATQALHVHYTLEKQFDSKFKHQLLDINIPFYNSTLKNHEGDSGCTQIHYLG